MYVALWKVIPGPLWARILVSAVGITVVIAALMMFVFPWVDAVMTPRDVTVQ
jgi:cytochrome b subunit of formate dehydrogenase